MRQIKKSLVRATLLGVTAVAVLVCSSAAFADASNLTPANAPLTARLDPSLFAQEATGVVLIRGFDCSGTARIEGTGFLVGSGVVMTARHVVDPQGAEARAACIVKVRVDGNWVRASRVSWWFGRTDPSGRATDLATLKLAQPADPSDYIFDFRNSSAPAGTNLAMLGHPLGTEISLTQGKLIRRIRYHTVPLMVIRMLGAAGSSGSPIVDNGGHVVGVLQLGLGLNETSGVELGIDLPSWWGSGRKVLATLCSGYPNGGVPGCDTSTTTTTTTTTTTSPGPPPTPAAPSAGYSIAACWTQYTAGSWSNVAAGKAATTFATSDLLANGPGNYWSVVQLTATTPADINGITVSLVAPNGTVSPSQPLTIVAGTSQAAYTFGWTSFATGAYFFQDVPPPARWIVRWQFPNGLSCDAPFTVS